MVIYNIKIRKFRLCFSHLVPFGCSDIFFSDVHLGAPSKNYKNILGAPSKNDKHFWVHPIKMIKTFWVHPIKTIKSRGKWWMGRGRGYPPWRGGDRFRFVKMAQNSILRGITTLKRARWLWEKRNTSLFLSILFFIFCFDMSTKSLKKQ